jgi:ABC-type uncharacterized transport system substrate-binding protein
VSDPVGDRFIASLSRPAGNLTGFIYVEGAMAGKWLGLLMEIAPQVKRVACIFNPDTTSGRGSYFLPSFEAAARLLGVESVVAPVQSDADIEKGRTRLKLEVSTACDRTVLTAAQRRGTGFARAGPHYPGRWLGPSTLAVDVLG